MAKVNPMANKKRPGESLAEFYDPISDKERSAIVANKPKYQTDAYDKADVVGKGKSCYGSGHDMSKLGEGKPHKS